MKSVLITKIATGSTVAQLRVTLKGVSYDPTPLEYYDAAWKKAVVTGLVNADDAKDEYRFVLLDVAIIDANSTNSPAAR